MIDYQLYFSFGSNMLEERFRDRCSTALLIYGFGMVSDYRLVFNRKGDYEDGGVASIISDPGFNVYGAIYALSIEDIEVLDNIESPNGDSYYRKEIEVETQFGQLITCFTYMAYPQGNFSPTKRYLNWIIEGAQNIGLPEKYIKFLRKIPAIT